MGEAKGIGEGYRWKRKEGRGNKKRVGEGKGVGEARGGRKGERQFISVF